MSTQPRTWIDDMDAGTGIDGNRNRVDTVYEWYMYMDYLHVDVHVYVYPYM
jgi:hypothetical protein